MEKVENVQEVRKLATVAKIEEIKPIEGADAIEVTRIRGWNVVVKKGEFKVGDLCIYCEIDSVLPALEPFEFLRNKKFRIKTIKLRGQVSQGIAFPLSVLEEVTNGKILLSPGNPSVSLAITQKNKLNKIPLSEEFDLTSIMGIVKWEPNIPANLAGKMKGNYPSHSIKTDEERIENLTKKYEELKTHKFYITEKLDGSSETIYLNDDVFGVTSRNIDLIETPDNTFWKVARELNIEEKMRTYAKEHGLRNFNLQGELIGEGIQGNKYGLKGQTIRFFRSFDIDKYEFSDYEVFVDMIAEMELETVPVLGIVELPETIDELKKFVQGKSKLNPKIEREGIVFVSVDFDKRRQGRLSFKGISSKFLLKNDE